MLSPLRNEAPNLLQLHRELTETLEASGRPYELVFVDDGSTDETFRMLADIHASDPHVVVVQFRRNFGQTAAFAAGFAHARGLVIVTSDGDLQNDPRDIPLLVDKLQEGYDIVCGWRRSRKDPWLTRRIPSMLANLANFVDDRRTSPRLRLFPQGVAFGGCQTPASLW